MLHRLLRENIEISVMNVIILDNIFMSLVREKFKSFLKLNDIKSRVIKSNLDSLIIRDYEETYSDINTLFSDLSKSPPLIANRV